jgi:hypothetical protein
MKKNNLKVAVVIPWRETPSRLPLKKYVDAWYRSNLPEAKIIYSDSGHIPFNLAASRNAGAEQLLDYDIIIHNDADVIPNIESLRKGIEETFKTNLFCNPYDKYKIMDRKSTKKVLLELLSYENAESQHIVGTCSGTVITTPKTWELVGKFDERFLGWGYEDVAIKVAHQAITGHDFLIIPGDLYGMSHVPNETKNNVKLMNNGLELLNKYFEASKDKESMLKLLELKNI